MGTNPQQSTNGTCCVLHTHLVRGQIPAMGEERYFLPTDDKPASLCAGKDMTLVRHHDGHVSNQERTHGGVAREFLQVEKRLQVLPRDKQSKEEEDESESVGNRFLFENFGITSPRSAHRGFSGATIYSERFAQPSRAGEVKLFPPFRGNHNTIPERRTNTRTPERQLWAGGPGCHGGIPKKHLLLPLPASSCRTRVRLV